MIGDHKNNKENEIFYDKILKRRISKARLR